MHAARIFVRRFIIAVVSLQNSEQIPWMGKLRRIRAGAAHKAEWMAPDEVVQQVQADYLAAARWLQDSLLLPPSQQAARASFYLDGPYLRHCQTLFRQHAADQPRLVGIMRADHQARVRHFSEDGRRCLVIDSQTQRRMATYDCRRHTRLHTQDLGDGAVVYQMLYDGRAKRWKIEAFVQELPAGWDKTPQRVRLSFILPAAAGRDH